MSAAHADRLDGIAEALFRCPRTTSALRVTQPGELHDLQRRCVDGTAQHANGSPVVELPESALVSDAAQVFYPVIRGVFCLLEELAIAMPGATIESVALDATKARVRSFYDELGWARNEQGVFEDAAMFEDLREVSEEYRKRANDRVREALPPGGTYLLDVASGAVQNDDYVSFSQNYERRICIDLSLTALLRARERIGEHGIFVLGDITNLPLHTDAVDVSISLHTIYHVPRDEQEQAFREVARVARERSVIVYAWGRSWSVFLQELPARVWHALKRLGHTTRERDRATSSSDATAPLFFAPLPRAWFTGRSWPFSYSIGVWRALTVPTLRAWAHERLGGRALLRAIARFEDRFPRAAGRYGRYPLITLHPRR